MIDQKIVKMKMSDQTMRNQNKTMKTPKISKTVTSTDPAHLTRICEEAGDEGIVSSDPISIEIRITQTLRTFHTDLVLRMSFADGVVAKDIGQTNVELHTSDPKIKEKAKSPRALEHREARLRTRDLRIPHPLLLHHCLILLLL